MPTLKLQGGLGNQMFGYALSYALSKEYDEFIYLDPIYLENRFLWANWTFRHFELDVFEIEKKYVSPNKLIARYIHPEILSFIRRIQYGNKYIKEKGGTFIGKFPENAYLDGWFQSYKYFDVYKNDMLEIFTVRTPLSVQNTQMTELIESLGNQSVSIHIRRGDYVSLEGANKWHGVCSIGYYEESIRQMIDKLGSPVFFVFSDDIAWCKENIHFPEGISYHFIDYNGSAGHEDLRLMYTCSHHIIANSSFSWWGAYLGRNIEKVIIAPKKWLQADAFSTKDLIPPTWLLI